VAREFVNFVNLLGLTCFFMSIYWRLLAAQVLQKGKAISPEVFKRFFKLPVSLVDLVWHKLNARFPGSLFPKHFLWTLHFLKTTNPLQEEVAQLLHTNKKTLKLHVRKVLLKLLVVLPKVCNLFICSCFFSDRLV
jgi:hypothetical protein